MARARIYKQVIINQPIHERYLFLNIYFIVMQIIVGIVLMDHNFYNIYFVQISGDVFDDAIGNNMGVDRAMGVW